MKKTKSGFSQPFQHLSLFLTQAKKKGKRESGREGGRGDREEKISQWGWRRKRKVGRPMIATKELISGVKRPYIPVMRAPATTEEGDGA